MQRLTWTRRPCQILGDSHSPSSRHVVDDAPAVQEGEGYEEGRDRVTDRAGSSEAELPASGGTVGHVRLRFDGWGRGGGGLFDGGVTETGGERIREGRGEGAA